VRPAFAGPRPAFAGPRPAFAGPRPAFAGPRPAFADPRPGESGPATGRLVRFGRVDSLVANAGIGAYGGILDQSDDELVEMINANFTGTVWSVHAALPPMLEAGGGDIVIVSSVAGLRGGADEAVYAGTKFAQVGLAGAVDRELREKGVRVTTMAPAAGAHRVRDRPWPHRGRDLAGRGAAAGGRGRRGGHDA
jgi:NAD(P)-dependent dehydrogenase (short-subunit alcohol dehydrogenase family)